MNKTENTTTPETKEENFEITRETKNIRRGHKQFMEIDGMQALCSVPNAQLIWIHLNPNRAERREKFRRRVRNKSLLTKQD